METWQVKAGGVGEGPAAEVGASALAQLVDAIGRRDFGETLLTVARERAGIDFLSSYDIEQAQQPQMYFSASTRRTDVSAGCFNAYQQRLYLSDESFDGVKSCAESSGLALGYWRASEFPSAHRAAIYDRHRIQERLSIVRASTPAPHGGARRFLAINFYRYVDAKRLADASIARISDAAATISACVSKHIEVCQSAAVPARSVEDALLSSCPELTPRELEVCAALMRGMSYDGVGAHLGLSLSSVKTYRARAYEKLGIHFRSELFRVGQLVR